MTPHDPSAEDWAEFCAEQHQFGVSVLCLDCARAYAREVGEAVREELVNYDWLTLLRGATQTHAREVVCKHGANMDYAAHEAQEIAAAIRQIEVKTP